MTLARRAVEGGGLLRLEKARQEIASCRKVDEVKAITDKVKALEAYARETGAAAEAINDLVEIRVRGDRRIGEITSKLAHKKGGTQSSRAAKTEPTKAEALEAAGLSKDRASRCEKLAEIPEEKLDAAISRARVESEEEEKPTSVADIVRLATHTSGADDYDGDEWYTPPGIVEAARRALGGKIDLDPASNLHAQSTVLAARFYSKKDNGLVQPWKGRVFCNPPYSMPLIEQFTEKLIAEFTAERTIAAIYLVNNCTDARWFQTLLTRFPVCFTAGRISFLNRSGVKFATRQGQAIFYLGDATQSFRESFTSIGTVVASI